MSSNVEIVELVRICSRMLSNSVPSLIKVRIIHIRFMSDTRIFSRGPTMLLPRHRGGKTWFAFEAKSFDIEVEEAKKECIWERRKGITLWIRFGGRSLTCLLMGLEDCVRASMVPVWENVWEKEGRRYKMEKGSNQAGAFI